MIKVIKPSPYDSVWYLDPGVPPDGTGYSFDDPILFQLHSTENNTRCTYTSPNSQYFYILMRLEANTSYELHIGSNTGPIEYSMFKQSDDSTVLQTFDYYYAGQHIFTVTETGNYIFRGTRYYVANSEEYFTITPAPTIISGEASWKVDKSRIQPGVWDENGVLTGYRDLHSAEVGFFNLPKVPQDGLWAYYPLTKDYKDYSGNKRNLNLNGTLATDEKNGTTGFSKTNNLYITNFVSGINPRSICMWFRFIGTDNNETAMFCQGTENYGQNFALDRHDDDQLRAHTYGWSDASYTLNGKNDLHHVVMTYSQESSTRRLMYIDGTLAKEWSASTNTSSTPMFFGIWVNGNTINGQYGFTGYMHDIALYDRELTADEVLAIYNAGNSLKGGN